jgi:hypothetical protein
MKPIMNLSLHRPINQDYVQGARGGKKRKRSHIGSAIEDYVEFKKMQTSKTIEALNEKRGKTKKFTTTINKFP